jgi:hypothetical protein
MLCHKVTINYSVDNCFPSIAEINNAFFFFFGVTNVTNYLLLVSRKIFYIRHIHCFEIKIIIIELIEYYSFYGSIITYIKVLCSLMN